MYVDLNRAYTLTQNLTLNKRISQNIPTTSVYGFVIEAQYLINSSAISLNHFLVILASDLSWCTWNGDFHSTGWCFSFIFNLAYILL